MDQINVKTITKPSQISSPILQAVLVLVVIILFGWFVVMPKSNQYSSQRSELVELQSQKANLDSDQAEVERLLSEMQSSDRELKLLDEALPLSDRPTRIAIMLESYAQSSAMILNQLNIADLDEKIASANKAVLADPYGQKRELQTIAVDLNLTGTLEQFKNFLILLESSGRIVDIESFSVTSGDQIEQFNIKLITYAYEPK